jgi:diguanylate cyclase (GGDEF)-like protein
VPTKPDPVNTATPALRQPPAWLQRLGLALPEPLETAYGLDQRRHAVEKFRLNILIILLLWGLTAIGIQLLMPAVAWALWLSLFCAVGATVLASAILSRLRRFDRWFTAYQTVGCFVTVTLAVAIIGVLPDSVPRELTEAAMMFCLVSVYTMAGLTLLRALPVAALGGMAGLLLAAALGGHVSRDLFLATYGGGSGLGLCLAYYNERHSRDLFRLQAAHVRHLERLSARDPLTGLANRRHLDEVLEMEWRRAFRNQSALAVMMIDIDKFKKYNDHFGHLKGDDCLRKIAAVIGSHARRPGDMAVRYGGEEFVLLLPGMDMNHALEHAERLLAAIRAANIPHAPNAATPMVCASVGLAVAVPFENWEPAFLLESADNALYAAKRDGGDCCRLSGLRLSPTALGIASSPSLAATPTQDGTIEGGA